MPELWSQREDTGPPPSPNLGGMAYDSDRGVTVLSAFVKGTPTPPAQTWEWDGSSWVQVDDMGPQAAYLVYVPDKHACLACQNVGGKGTWERKDGLWTQLADTGPAYVAGMAYDTTRSRAVAVAFRPSAAIETWEWDGQAWTVVADTGPMIYQGSTITYDASNKVTVLYGGETSDTKTPTGDTWLWDGVRWKKASDMGPPARMYAGFAYDDNNKRGIAFRWVHNRRTVRGHMDVGRQVVASSQRHGSYGTLPPRIVLRQQARSHCSLWRLRRQDLPR